jgi:exonuclease III
MAAFLLWNVNGKASLDGLVENLVLQRQIDVVLLLEYAFGVSQLPGLLMPHGLYKRPSPTRFGVFVRGSHQFLRMRYRVGHRASIWKWIPPSPSRLEGLVVLIHGLDRRNYDDGTRRVFFRRVADAVRRCERKQHHQRTIVAGDLNAHPFESAVAAADGLHALGIKAVRGAATRAVREGGAATHFFYNPMWRAYGHATHPEAGAATYYWMHTRGHELGWYMLDQVVLRPGEANRFPEDRLNIITNVGGIPLLNAQGLPDSQTASDHLPLVFHWNL